MVSFSLTASFMLALGCEQIAAGDSRLRGERRLQNMNTNNSQVQQQGSSHLPQIQQQRRQRHRILKKSKTTKSSKTSSFEAGVGAAAADTSSPKMGMMMMMMSSPSAPFTGAGTPATTTTTARTIATTPRPIFAGTTTTTRATTTTTPRTTTTTTTSLIESAVGSTSTPATTTTTSTTTQRNNNGGCGRMPNTTCFSDFNEYFQIFINTGALYNLPNTIRCDGGFDLCVGECGRGSGTRAMVFTLNLNRNCDAGRCGFPGMEFYNPAVDRLVAESPDMTVLPAADGSDDPNRFVYIDPDASEGNLRTINFYLASNRQQLVHWVQVDTSCSAPIRIGDVQQTLMYVESQSPCCGVNNWMPF